MVIILNQKAIKEDIAKASEEFGDYIKIVADIEKEIVAIGGKLHADSEKKLLESGSAQKNIWGGGLDLETKIFDTQAMINIRPLDHNNSMEILSPKIRDKFLKICSRLLSDI